MAKHLRIFSLLLSLIGAFIPIHAQGYGKGQALGVLENGVYHNNLTGIELTIPPNWVIASQAPSSTPDAQVLKLKDSASNAVGTVWMKRRNAETADLQALMNDRLAVKAVQRNNFQSYTYRPESVQHTTINGHPALSAIADYVMAGQKMVEYLTWIDGEKSRVVFEGRVPPAELANFQALVDPVIQSAVVP
ncbi:MAG TPA: hypothetical protein VEK33_20300 [Terriglobales bacterium]|nr:hypothetical protein [Terriglobales bacterium]